MKKACLINDFVAVGLGVPALGDCDLVHLHTPCIDGNQPNGSDGAVTNEDFKVQGGAMAAVGVGTGLGAVYMTLVKLL